MAVVTEAEYIAELRRQAVECGYDIVKSDKAISREKNRGFYRIVDVSTGAIVAGHRFELTHGDVADKLRRMHVL